MDEARRARVYVICNCLAIFVVALNLTAPVHEACHLITQMFAGMQPAYLGFGAAMTVGTPVVDVTTTFWKVMYSGSAALLNVVVGLVCLCVLRRHRLGPLSRTFVLMLTLLHLCMGFGYFLRDGVIVVQGSDSMGDWAKVLANFDYSPALRAMMIAVGTLGILTTFYIAWAQAFRFIRTNDDKRERHQVSSALYLIPYLFNIVLFTPLNLLGPLGFFDTLMVSGLINVFGYIPLFWGYMFCTHLVRPMGKSVYLFSPCAERKPLLWAAGIAVVLIDAFVLCPGIYFA